MSVNKAILIGRLGNDPVFNHTPTGTPVCNFNVATHENWTDKSKQKQERTEWHRIVAWQKLAEICRDHLHKGSQVYVEGKLVTRKWEQDGHTKYSTEVHADVIRFLGEKSMTASHTREPGDDSDSFGEFR